MLMLYGNTVFSALREFCVHVTCLIIHTKSPRINGKTDFPVTFMECQLQMHQARQYI